MNVTKHVLILIVLSFVLTTSASAAMMCCWNMNQEKIMTDDVPCHDSEDIDNSDAPSLDCCDDMAQCKVPLVYGSTVNSLLNLTAAHGYIFPNQNQWVLASSTGPPTPPPKFFL